MPIGNRPIRVSGVTELTDALLVTGFPFRYQDRIEEFLVPFRQLLRETSGIRRDGSAALDLCSVAAGRLDGFWEFGLSPWDVAAGALIVQEAGGMVTDFAGGTDWLEGRTIIAAAPGVHPRLRSIFQEPLFGSGSLFKPTFLAYASLCVAAGFLAKGRSRAQLAALTAMLAAGVQLWKTAAAGSYVEWYYPFLLIALVGATPFAAEADAAEARSG